ncbi:MAG: YeeE/YedE family protein [Hyphomicrobiales bacterium]|nr:YeeE/YedE family protein [Hyphomicrobiales bacterium]
MSGRIAPLLAALGCGFVFGLGLLISGMTQPSKVLGFLDIFGAWDPSLAVVMAAALAVSGPGTLLVRRWAQPLLAPGFERPSRARVDPPLIAGAALFGIGWGLVGLCPGPALENLATLSPQVLVFCLAMVAGMSVHDHGLATRLAAPSAASAADG